jgi:hypothetical protein|tara:strand:+ start:248 stop:400 length:153 start_codon:yes stop_codon:yes gene_type:complete
MMVLLENSSEFGGQNALSANKDETRAGRVTQPARLFSKGSIFSKPDACWR